MYLSVYNALRKSNTRRHIEFYKEVKDELQKQLSTEQIQKHRNSKRFRILPNILRNILLFFNNFFQGTFQMSFMQFFNTILAGTRSRSDSFLVR